MTTRRKEQVVSVGDARQQPYKPFADPNRAVMEEFGDLIAEGLYALFNDGQVTGCGDGRILGMTSSTHAGSLSTRIADDLCRIPTHEAAVQACESMQHAGKQLASITAEECVRFVDAWRHDRGSLRAGRRKKCPGWVITRPRASTSKLTSGAKPSSGSGQLAARTDWSRPSPCG